MTERKQPLFQRSLNCPLDTSSFVGNKWTNMSSEEKKLYLKNTYRVLLTRARQGFIIFIPNGSSTDATRNPIYYNGTYSYLRSFGIEEI